nr:TonB-dependent receptor [uncultured Capnocytophaga sp.]
MNTNRLWLSLLAFFLMTTLSAQTITGVVLDDESKEPLLGANVLVKGTNIGASSDIKGNFTLKTTQKKGTLVVSFVSFQTKEVPFTIVNGKATLKITLLPEAEELTGVTITGNALMDIAKERKTPVAVSTIRASEIVTKLGNQEFPELLNRTPSVYATKGGGGYGDSKINIRGFGNENIAVMINGMPINDMENGKVYWSNWAGIADVTSSMQVQRGLGASKLAIASVGGTINIVTRASDMAQGGNFSASYGNDGFYKGVFSYNTGKSKKGWSSSILLSRTAGATYVRGTDFEGHNYFFSLGYAPNQEHNFQFIFTGAPQWHHQRTNYITIANYLKYGNGEPDRRYNADWGYYKGKEYSFQRNTYHKPVMMLNWDWNIDDKSSLSTVLYASFGRGAGTRDMGGAWSGGLLPDGRPRMVTASEIRTSEGLIDFDRIVKYNQGEDISTAEQAIEPHGTPYVANASREVIVGGRTVKVTEGFARKGSVNSHNWYGFLTNFTHKLSDHFSFSVGLDGRYYNGYHYEVVSDLLGTDFYRDNFNSNITLPRNVHHRISDMPTLNPFGESIENVNDRITYSNEGHVRWLGAFGQLEYTNEKLSAFAQWSSSIQAFQRTDDFLRAGTLALRGRPETAMQQVTTYKSLPGYNMKAGANYNIDKQHNVFANVGYYSRQPFFNAVYPNYKNFVNPRLSNEKIFGVELGYGFKRENLSVNLNLYNTVWSDRYVRRDSQWDRNTQYFVEMLGITEIHRGVEVDAIYRINKYLRVNGMFSLGDWFYQGGADVSTFLQADNTEYILSGRTSNQFHLDLDKMKVGDSAQMTANVGVEVTPIENFNIDINWRYVNDLYAKIDVSTLGSRTNNTNENSIKLPEYNLFDVGASYKYKFPKGRHSITVLANVNNVLDTTYIAESDTNIHTTNSSVTYKGIDVRNKVFFGFGRTWNIGLKYHF